MPWVRRNWCLRQWSGGLPKWMISMSLHPCFYTLEGKRHDRCMWVFHRSYFSIVLCFAHRSLLTISDWMSGSLNRDAIETCRYAVTIDLLDEFDRLIINSHAPEVSEYVSRIGSIVKWYKTSILKKLNREIHQIQPTPSKSSNSTYSQHNRLKLT